MLLDVQNIETHYGLSQVLQQVSLQIDEGETIALLGRNGAGKSTFLKSIIGLVPPQSGDITFDMTRINDLEPFKIARLGISYMPETRGIFPSLTIEEHLKLVENDAKNEENQRIWRLDDVYSFFPRLKERRRNLGKQLSGGEQQMLAIGRSLLQNPKLILMDEPLEGLAPTIVKDITDVLLKLKQQGLTILLVEQNYQFATRLADRVYILGNGIIQWSGNTKDLKDNQDIVEQWLGLKVI